MSWNTTQPLFMQSGATLNNQALFVATADTLIAYNGGNAPSFNNNASGTVRAAAGKTLNVGSIAFNNNAGTLDAAAGATINYSGGTSTFNNDTKFTGAGTNLVTNNVVFNDRFTSGNLVLQSGTYTGNAAPSW